MFTLDMSEDAEMPSSTTNQKLYLAGIFIGLFAGWMVIYPQFIPKVIGSVAFLVSATCLLAIPYNLLGLTERGDEGPIT